MAQSNADFLKERFANDAPAPSADPNAAFLQSMFAEPTPHPAAQRTVQDVGDAIIYGLKASSGGLAYTGQAPDMQMSESAPISQRIGAMVGGVVGDLPAMVAGGLAGSFVSPGLGTAAGAFAAPMALRDALMEAYSNGHAASWEGAWEVAKAALTGGGKGAIIGLATAGAGKYVAPLFKPLGKAAEVAGTFGTELTALTTTSAALEGRMPTAQDFLDNGILLAGMKGAVGAAKGLRQLYADTGIKPDEAMARALKDPALKDAILGKDGTAFPPDIIEMKIEQRVQAALTADARPDILRELMTAPKPDTPAALGQSPIAKLINWDYVIDQPTLKALMADIDSMYSAEIAKQTRGVRPNMQTAADGLKMAVDGDVAQHVIGRAENAEQIVARTHVLRAASDNVFNVMKDLAGKTEDQLTTFDRLKSAAAMEQLAMVVADFRGARAEAGRALQIFRALKTDPTMYDQAEQIVKLYERNGKMPFTGLAKAIGAFQDPAQLAKFAEGMTKATTMEKVMEVWKSAILSGPQTHLANILGNIGKWAVEVPESALSATIEAGRRAIKGDPMKFAQWKARAFQPFIGLQLGAKDAIITAAEVIKQGGDHLEKGDVFRKAIEGTKGDVIRLPFRLLQAGDVLFRTPAERGKAYELAVDRAVKEGYNPSAQEGVARIATLFDSPTLDLNAEAAAKVTDTIQSAGGEAVFAQRLGWRMEMMQRAMQGSPIQFVIPFVRTPVNLLSWAVQHTPGMNLLSARWRSDFAAGGEAQSRAIARVAIGTGMALTAYQWAQNGTVTGGGMFDKEMRGTKGAEGWQPYSFLIDGKYYSYQRIEPVAKVLGLAADLVEMMKVSNDPGHQAKTGAMLVAMFGNATISTTYLSGLANTVQALTDPERYGGNLIEQYASSVVPKIVGQSVMMSDPYKREVDGALEAIQSQLPWLREKLMPVRDVWGDPKLNEKLWKAMPVATSAVNSDKVKQEAVRLQIAIGDAPKYLYEAGPVRPAEKRIELTAEQKDIFKQVSGKEAMSILAPIVNSPAYEQWGDLARGEMFRSVIEDSRKLAQMKTLSPMDPQRVQLRQEILNKIKQRSEPTPTTVK